MFDKIEKIDNSLVQHGSFSDRIYLMKLSSADMPTILTKLDKLANENNYGKIIAKIPATYKDTLLQAGYTEEANIPCFYDAKEKAIFMAKYNLDSRKHPKNLQEITSCLEKVHNSPKKSFNWEKHPYEIRMLKKEELHELCKLYEKVFISYPFPIFDREYLAKTMDENIKYFGVFDLAANNKIVAAASSEIDFDNKNVEMTDFATLPDYRGKNLASSLLIKMELEMKRIHIKTAYTIARAKSIGMNLVFHKQDYTFSGTLINNTNICGQIESMNVWHKSL